MPNPIATAPRDRLLQAGMSEFRLLREHAYVDGGWCEAESGARLAVFNPATGEMVGHVPNLGPEEAKKAIAAAARALHSWRRFQAIERGERLRRWAELMRFHRAELSFIMTLEQGKPLSEAAGEVDYAASFLDWFAAEGERLDGEVLTSHLAARRLFSFRVPVGVSVAITPWNFPSAMITRKAGAALAAGCTMIVRPASETPFSALALAALAEEAGIPPGVFSVLTGDPEPFAQVVMEEPAVRQISFTGSTRVGRLLAAQAASTVKRVALELGGHAPMIIRADADVDIAVAGAVAAKFQTSGQDCLAANRIFVARPLYEAFCRRFADMVDRLIVGDGLDEGVQIGPLINEAAVARCRRQVEDALAKGARLLTRRQQAELGPNFFAPGVLADVTPDMDIFCEETFGPLAAVLPFDEDKDAVRLANETEYGLAAYLFGRDVSALWRMGEALDYGMVAFNTVKMTGPPVPFGGVKQSGLGREGSRHGIHEYTELKYFCIAGLTHD
jgi:succinate-semialdehyde dehydrogenase